jgi:mRNA interferase MazF
VKRGEVWWVDFEPALGSEIKKARPAIIVSNDMSNKHLNRVQVVPLSSNTGKLYPSEVVVTVKDTKSKAMADQIMTADKQRFKSRIDQLSVADMKAVERVIKIQLGLPL